MCVRLYVLVSSTSKAYHSIIYSILMALKPWNKSRSLALGAYREIRTLVCDQEHFFSSFATLVTLVTVQRQQVIGLGRLCLRDFAVGVEQQRRWQLEHQKLQRADKAPSS